MKKIISIILGAAFAVSLCSCGAKKAAEPIPTIEPTELVTAEDVTTITGYTPIIEASETMRDGNRSQVMYRSETLGQYDPVIVKLIQFDDNMDYQQIFNYYEQQKALRQDAELIESLGQEAYIAFPTIHVYDRGCLIEITAGSGEGDDQRTLLKNFAVTAAGRLEAIVPEYKGQ